MERQLITATSGRVATGYPWQPVVADAIAITQFSWKVSLLQIPLKIDFNWFESRGAATQRE